MLKNSCIVIGLGLVKSNLKRYVRELFEIKQTIKKKTIKEIFFLKKYNKIDVFKQIAEV